MKKNLMKRLAAATLAGAMVLSMNGMAWATEGKTVTGTATATIQKVLKKPAEVYAPKTDFEFDITYAPDMSDIGSALTDMELKDAQEAINMDDTGATKDKKINSTPSADDLNKTEIAYAEKIELKADVSKFHHPGVYRYKVTEKVGTYEGITYDSSEKYFEVRVVYGENDTLKILTQMFLEKNTKDNKWEKNDGIFINEYGVGEASGKLADLEAKKLVTGNIADRNKDYEFTISIDNTTGKKYSYKLGTEDGLKEVTDNKITISLKHNDTVTIYGLSKSDKYTVAEKDYAGEGYKTSYVIDDGPDGNAPIESEKDKHSITTGEQSLMTDVENVKDTNVTFTNEKNADNPATGIITTFAPYILLIAAAGVFAVLFLRKKRNDDEY